MLFYQSQGPIVSLEGGLYSVSELDSCIPIVDSIMKRREGGLGVWPFYSCGHILTNKIIWGLTE